MYKSTVIILDTRTILFFHQKIMNIQTFSRGTLNMDLRLNSYFRDYFVLCCCDL